MKIDLIISVSISGIYCSLLFFGSTIRKGILSCHNIVLLPTKIEKTLIFHNKVHPLKGHNNLIKPLFTLLPANKTPQKYFHAYGFIFSIHPFFPLLHSKNCG